MIVTPATLGRLAGRAPNANMASVIKGLIALPSGIDRPHRLARYLGQTGHESMGWIYDREIWGDTPAQVRYDTRADLGNTPARDGDGYLYRGRTGIQITGKANTRAFRDWCAARFPDVPDFVATPDAMNTDPWEGLGPIWYWTTRVADGRTLNQMCDQGDDLALTRAINGGTNGLADRLDRSMRAGLELSGHATVRAFQHAHSLAPDGIAGPITRGVMHKVLMALPPVTFSL